MLKKIFPLSFKSNDSVSALVIGVIIYVVIGIIGGVLIGLTGALSAWVPFVGYLLSAVGTLIDLYITAGIVILFLAHFKVIKD